MNDLVYFMFAHRLWEGAGIADFPCLVGQIGYNQLQSQSPPPPNPTPAFYKHSRIIYANQARTC